MLSKLFFSMLFVVFVGGEQACPVPDFLDGRCDMECLYYGGVPKFCPDGSECFPSCVAPTVCNNTCDKNVTCHDGVWVDYDNNKITSDTWDGIVCEEHGVEHTESNVELLNVWPCCFDSEGTVQVLNEGEREVHEVRIGDQVLSSDENGQLFYDKVYFIREHKERDSVRMYGLKSEGANVGLTSNHLIHVTRETATDDYCMNVNGKQACATRAADVQVGDTIWVTQGTEFVAQPVKEITIYNGNPRTFYTLKGNAIVSNAVVSVHSTHHTFGQAVQAPVRIAYYISADLPNHPVMEKIWFSLDTIRRFVRSIFVDHGFQGLFVAGVVACALFGVIVGNLRAKKLV